MPINGWKNTCFEIIYFKLKLNMRIVLLIVIGIIFSFKINAQAHMIIYYHDGSVGDNIVSEIDSIVYTNVDPGPLAQFGNTGAYAITDTSMTVFTEVTSEGGSYVTNKGICWSTSPNPEVFVDDFNDVGPGIGFFETPLSGLPVFTTIYVRPYAVNSAGLVYGSEYTYNTLNSGAVVSNPGAGVTDVNGNNYTTIVLGNGQEWMSKNLQTLNYANGDPITNVTTNLEWSSMLFEGGYCSYDNSTANISDFGLLYNFYTIEDARNVCPANWHVPTNAELNYLMDYLGGIDFAGSKLKSTGNLANMNGLWESSNSGATNSSGFSGIPGGRRLETGGFNEILYTGFYWINLPNQASSALYYLTGNSEAVFVTFEDKKVGASIRCLKD